MIIHFNHTDVFDFSLLSVQCGYPISNYDIIDYLTLYVELYDIYDKIRKGEREGWGRRGETKDNAIFHQEKNQE